jgi:hypothetical protein
MFFSSNGIFLHFHSKLMSTHQGGKSGLWIAGLCVSYGSPWDCTDCMDRTDRHGIVRIVWIAMGLYVSYGSQWDCTNHGYEYSADCTLRSSRLFYGVPIDPEGLLYGSTYGSSRAILWRYL